MAFTDEDVLTHFFTLATQYYVAGRYAAQVTGIPVAGNLLHHAIEMYLKGGLGKKGLTLAELKKLGHNLPAIWEAFKSKFGLSTSSPHNQVIRDLHDFEELRYPDSVLNRGMMGRISMTRDAGLVFHAQSSTLP